MIAISHQEGLLRMGVFFLIQIKEGAWKWELSL